MQPRMIIKTIKNNRIEKYKKSATNSNDRERQDAFSYNK